jgi:hypothetical protein
MDEQLWRGWQELLWHYIAAPGIARYWDIRGQFFSERFREFISHLEPAHDRRTVGTLLGQEDRSE